MLDDHRLEVGDERNLLHRLGVIAEDVLGKGVKAPFRPPGDAERLELCVEQLPRRDVVAGEVEVALPEVFIPAHFAVAAPGRPVEFVVQPHRLVMGLFVIDHRLDPAEPLFGHIVADIAAAGVGGGTFDAGGGHQFHLPLDFPILPACRSRTRGEIGPRRGPCSPGGF